MFDGAGRRVVSLWFPRLASDRALRRLSVDGPFALTLRQNNSDRIHCLNVAAERRGLHRGMSFSDARAFCPDLQSRPAEPMADRRFLGGVRRWATRYCPWVGLEGDDGLALDVTGSTHLAGGEAAMLDDMRRRFRQAGLTVKIGLGDTRGAAWALARHGEGTARPGAALDALGPLPAAGLRLEAETVTALQRLGLRTIGQLAGMARAPLARRFGPETMMRLDQALGTQPEQISPLSGPPHYGVGMSLPEPIGLEADVMAAVARLLDRLCDRLRERETGARALVLTLSRVDRRARPVELRLARPMRDPSRILPLFTRGIGRVDAGYGIDRLRLEATEVEALKAEQVSCAADRAPRRLDDLVTRIGVRIGLENVQRFLPADSHIPERSFFLAPAARSSPETFPARARARPLIVFPPEPIAAAGARPPERFRWRRIVLTTIRATGPERISPEWWFDDPNWRNGVRDYWRVETLQGRRLWLFHTPQNPGWFAQGEFA